MITEEKVLKIRNLKHVVVDYRSRECFTLHVEEIDIKRGEFLALVGPTGCGKSTLLGILGLLRRPTRADEFTIIEHPAGDGYATEHNILKLWCNGRTRQISDLRRQLTGHALQRPDLIPALTVSENVAVPMALNHASNVAQRVTFLLKGLSRLDDDGASDLLRIANNRVHQISGGQAQRVGVARSVAHGPMLLLADEPTSNLDQATARRVLEFLDRMREAEGVTILMISHALSLVEDFADRLIHMECMPDNVGRVVDERILRPEGDRSVVGVVG